MLDLLYLKCNPLITTSIDSSLFKKIFKTNLREKCKRKILFLLGYCNDKIIINTKTTFLYSTCS